MKSTFLSVSLLGCVALGLATTGCSSDPNAMTEQPMSSESLSADVSAPAGAGSTLQGAAPQDQARVAQTTLRLENEFSGQFVRGRIDRPGLKPVVDDVIQAMPEAARAKVQQHVAEVIDEGERLAAQLTPEQRAAVTAAPSKDQLTKVQIDAFTAWGWPGAAGWGGLGAFGFPGLYYYQPYAYGYATPFGSALGSGFASGFSTGYASGFSSSTATSTTTIGGCGFGVGCFGLGGVGWL